MSVMKLYLASFMEKHNFGKGEVISITHSTKPRDIVVQSIYLPFTPPAALIKKYNEMKVSSQKEAGEMFEQTYRKQLEDFYRDAAVTANQEGKSIQELLPFNDGDTLCSWERSAYTHYRKTLAPVLREMGYEVVAN